MLTSRAGGQFPLYQDTIDPMSHTAIAFPGREKVNIN